MQTQIQPLPCFAGKEVYLDFLLVSAYAISGTC